MTDLVKRLRDGVARKASGHSALWDAIMAEAADEIERLEAEKAELSNLITFLQIENGELRQALNEVDDDAAN